MPNVPIVKYLPLFTLKQKHQLAQHYTSSFIEERTNHCLTQRGLSHTKKRHWLYEVDLVLEFVVIGPKIIEIFVEDDADDDFVVLNRHSAAYGAKHTA